ncbi:LexA family protein [Pseudomonas sp. NCHU5208]|uniref:LexA family protein n=1 Tax=unclassified Pseudomonas TaxID=196821 RepID=UPI003F957339
MTSFLELGRIVPSGICVPLYSTHISAGFPSPADDYAEASLSLDELANVRAPHTYILLVTDESMSGKGISCGDLLIVDRAMTAQAGDVVVTESRDSAIRTLAFDKAGRPKLLSSNPHYPPIVFGEAEELVVYGVVTFSLHRLRTTGLAAEPADLPRSLDALVNIRAPSTYLVRAAGDSMVGVGIYPGDILVICRACEAQPGDVVIACVQGDFTVKTLTVQHDKRPVLQPANPRYPTIEFAAGDELRLFGVATFSLHKHCARVK